MQYIYFVRKINLQFNYLFILHEINYPLFAIIILIVIKKFLN